ncbi:flagellar biosynthesis protein FliO, partial [Salmonella enterica subsp. enterica serovar Poona]
QSNLLHSLPPAENATQAPVPPPADFHHMMTSLLKRAGRS